MKYQLIVYTSQGKFFSEWDGKDRFNPAWDLEDLELIEYEYRVGNNSCDCNLSVNLGLRRAECGRTIRVESILVTRRDCYSRLLRLESHDPS